MPKRWWPDAPLPPYSFVPGKFPHPVNDPAGHLYGRAPEAVATEALSNWSRSEPYLFGIDLFNFGFYWEAHEAWEAVWKAAGHNGTQADFFKGLIKLAAAAVKLREGNAEGARRHAERADELFRAVQAAIDDPPSIYWGLSLTELQRLAALVAGPLADTVHEPQPTSQWPLELCPQPDCAA